MFKNSVIFPTFTVACILITALASSMVEKLNGTITANNNSCYIISLSKDVLVDAIDMETGVRGYLLSGNSTYLEPYYSGQTSFDLDIDKLEKTPALSTVSKEKIIRVKKLHENWIKKVEPIIKDKKKSFLNPKNNTEVSKAEALERKSIMDTLRTELRSVEDEEKIRLNMSLENTERYKNFARVITYTCPALFVILIFFLYKLIENANKEKTIAQNTLEELMKKRRTSSTKANPAKKPTTRRRSTPKPK